MKLLEKLVIVFVSLDIITTIMASRGGAVGGITNDEKPSGQDVQDLLTSLSSEIKVAALEAYSKTDGNTPDKIEEHLKTASITPLGHKTQLVAGNNYFVRTKIGDYIFHVRIYRDLKKNASVTRVIGPKQEADPIDYF